MILEPCPSYPRPGGVERPLRRRRRPSGTLLSRSVCFKIFRFYVSLILRELLVARPDSVPGAATTRRSEEQYDLYSLSPHGQVVFSHLSKPNGVYFSRRPRDEEHGEGGCLSSE